jgi:acyl carrier protein
VTRTDLLAALTQIFRENFGDEGLVLTLTTTARDIPGWDSAKMVFLVLAVEERFDVRFRSKEIDGLRSIGDWVELIETASARPPSPLL